MPPEKSFARSQPWHCSLTGRQPPPVKEQPLGFMKVQAVPAFKVVQSMGITPLLYENLSIYNIFFINVNIFFKY